MSALKGKLTFSRFFVLGDVPEDLSGSSLKRIRAQAFEPLDPDEDIKERHGWASVVDPFDTEIDHEKCFFNEYLVLSMRLDRWAIPSALLKAQLADAERKLLEKKGMESLGRKAKAELKEMVTKKLRRQLVPVTKTFDLVWNLQTHVALFHSHSKKQVELVQELFEKTFKLRLLLETPGTASDRRDPSPALQQAFANLEPTSLASTSSFTGELTAEALS